MGCVGWSEERIRECERLAPLARTLAHQYAKRWTRCREEMESTAMEMLVIVMQKREDLWGSALEDYFAGAVRREMITVVRRESRYWKFQSLDAARGGEEHSETGSGATLADALPAPDGGRDRAEHADNWDIVMNSFAQLTFSMRMILRWRFVEDLSFELIAARMQSPLTRVRNEYAQAVRILQRRLNS